MGRNKGKAKSWKFWTFFVAVPIIVVISLSMAAYVVYVKRTSWKKQGAAQGRLYAQLNRHTEAVDEFEKKLKEEPENAEIHYYMGLSYIKLKEYDKASEAFNKAINFKPDYSNARLQLAAIKLEQAADLRKLGKSEPLVLEMLLEAEEACRDTIEKDPDFVKAYAMLGDIHSFQGLIDDAIMDYKRMLEVENSSVNGHIALAGLYVNKKDLDMAK
ncbi:MAG: tetratricopeptide repeat protein, partial [Candidatus Brocadiaceae bacterium]|nr:tetratricopeptide repeat protein [Candidatus Brocadiaceae bacterium]